MPRATVSSNAERFDLKSCAGGFVIIRRMTYGEKLTRQDNMIDTNMGKGEELKISLLARKAAMDDFANLVVDHNLTDDTDRPLNFKNPADVAQLDPRIGDEIGQLIDELNSFGDIDSKN